MRHIMLTLSGALGNCIDLFFVVCSGVITSSKFHLICISHGNVAVVMFYFVIA